MPFEQIPYTNFHGTNQDWMIQQIKQMIADWASYRENLDAAWAAYQENINSWRQALDAAFTELHTYVHDYFDNLDVQQEINNKLDQMREEGVFDEILLPYFNDYTVSINNRMANQDTKITTLETRVDNFLNNTGSLGTEKDPELIDVRVGANDITYDTAGEAVRDQVKLLSTIQHNFNDDQLQLYDIYREIPTTASWPARSFNRNISTWNGSFSETSENYYSDIINPGLYSSTYSYALTHFETIDTLIKGHTYKLSARLLSGDISVPTDGVAEVVIEKIASCDIGSETTFTFNGNNTIIYYHFTKNITFTDADILLLLEDITEKEKTSDLVRLSGYKWATGRIITRGASITEPEESLVTISMTESIPYDAKIYFVLKEGYKAAFVSVENNLITGISRAFISTPGRIDMVDVYNNMGPASVNTYGDSFAIMLRNANESSITLNSFNVDDALEMHVVKKADSATKPKKWVAIGDSITDGRCTVLNNENVVSKTNHFSQYGYLASKILGIETYIEQGYGGMGYIHVANDGTYLADVLNLNFNDPDIITVCLGVNDRSQTIGDENSTANDGTISGSIRNCCEVLGAKYPNAHIIFLTPLNSWATGSAETGWCKRSGPTHLDDIATMVKYWATRYGFPVIDMLNESPVNDFNIQTMILDKLHPTMEAHYMIGHYLAGVLPYNV